MSTYWGYVCLTHDPPLHSEHWLNHGEETLTRFLAAFRAGGYTSETYPLPSLGVYGHPSTAPAGWLADHPKCRLALGNEYGEVRDLDEGAPL